MAEIAAQLEALAFCMPRIMENLKKKDEASITSSVVQGRLDVLEELWVQYEEVHDELLRAAANDTKVAGLPHFAEDRFGATEDVYLDHKGQFLELLQFLQEKDPTADGSSQASTSGEETESRGKLSEISLPTFDGRYSDWPSFRNFFASLIVDDASLTDEERLYCLKDCLKGEAEMLLRNVSIAEANFKWAWELLTNRYENRRLLVRDQLSTLSSLPVVTKESSEELRALFSGTFSVVGTLAQIGRPVDSSADWLVHLTVEKLDRQTRLDWETTIGNTTDPPSLENLREFLDRQIRVLEVLEQHRVDTPADNLQSTSQSAHRVLANAPKNCHLCHGQHYIGYCTQYQRKSTAERREVVRSLRLCLNCLGTHDLTACANEKRCQQCADNHHTSLHDPTLARVRRRRRRNKLVAQVEDRSTSS